jgi:hypothetical protein
MKKKNDQLTPQSPSEIKQKALESVKDPALQKRGYSDQLLAR